MKGGRAWFLFSGKKWLWIIICVFIGLFATVSLFRFESYFQHKNKLSAFAPGNADVSCLGRLLPGGRILQVGAPHGAIIGELLVRRGQWVEQGEIIARLRDHAREKAALLRTEKDIAVAASELDRVRAGEKANTIEAQQAAVARQEAILRQKETHYERMRKLYEKQIIAAGEFEEVQAQKDAAKESLVLERQHLESLRDIRKEDLALAASKVKAAEGSQKVARENLELNIIRAPVSGYVLDIYAFPGEAVSERGILELGRGREMMVEAEVYVNDIGRVHVGAPAVISGDAFSGSIKGRVVEIVSMVNRSAVTPSDPLAFSDLRIVKVLIRLDDSRTVANLGNHQVSVTIKP